jgi:hypothetical protein
MKYNQNQISALLIEGLRLWSFLLFISLALRGLECRDTKRRPAVCRRLQRPRLIGFNHRADGALAEFDKSIARSGILALLHGSRQRSRIQGDYDGAIADYNSHRAQPTLPNYSDFGYARATRKATTISNGGL